MNQLSTDPQPTPSPLMEISMLINSLWGMPASLAGVGQSANRRHQMHVVRRHQMHVDNFGIPEEASPNARARSQRIRGISPRIAVFTALKRGRHQMHVDNPRHPQSITRKVPTHA